MKFVRSTVVAAALVAGLTGCSGSGGGVAGIGGPSVPKGQDVKASSIKPNLSQPEQDALCEQLFGPAADGTKQIYKNDKVATKWHATVGNNYVAISCELQEMSGSLVVELWVAADEHWSTNPLVKNDKYFGGAKLGNITPDQLEQIKTWLKNAIAHVK